MHNIKVVIHGAMGKMGKETVNAVCRESDLDPVGAVITKLKLIRIPYLMDQAIFRFQIP